MLARSVPAPAPLRLRDALRDLVRAPHAGSFVIAAALAIVAMPIIYTNVFATRAIAHAADGRAAFKLYELWLVRAFVLAAFASRLGGALIASAMIEGRTNPRMSLTEAVARVIMHGLPALLAGALALALTWIGLVAVVVGALPLAAATLVAGPVAGVEQRGPFAAIRRSAALTRGARKQLGAWIAALVAIELAPIFILRFGFYAPTAKKPPLAPVLRAQEIHGWIVVAIAVLAAAAQVAIYARLRAGSDVAAEAEPERPVVDA
jgi:hypothetical protein